MVSEEREGGNLHYLDLEGKTVTKENIEKGISTGVNLNSKGK